jgi:hypothetical protein
LHSILDGAGPEVDQAIVSRLASKSSSPPVTRTEYIAQRALDVLNDEQKKLMYELLSNSESASR